MIDGIFVALELVHNGRPLDAHFPQLVHRDGAVTFFGLRLGGVLRVIDNLAR